MSGLTVWRLTSRNVRSRRHALRSAIAAIWTSVALVGGGVAQAHTTPPVRLESDREAISRLLPGAQKFFVREGKLSQTERATIKRQTNWNPDENAQRFHLGRDADGRLTGGVVFVTEYTMHGPVRVAVGLGPDGRVKGARVVEVSEEAYFWVRPLIDQDFVRDYVGQDARGQFGLSDRLERVATGSMPRFYGRVLTSLLQRAALLFEVGVLERGDRG